MSKPEKPEYGTFLQWPDIERHVKHLHDVSVQHLIEVWPALNKRVGNPSTWGDEVEYQILGFDSDNKQVSLVMGQEKVLDKLTSSEEDIDIQPEYTRYMVESAPSKPYNGDNDMLSVYESLKERRKIINSALKSNQTAFTLSLFPLLQVLELSKALEDSPKDDYAVFKGSVAPVGRYETLHENLEERSRQKYHAEVPLFLDTNTIKNLKGSSREGKDIMNLSGKEPVIHLEDLVFAMGGCGLQATFQTKTLSDVRLLHDQLSILGPILLSLTASTPIYKGMLADTDTRWNQACRMVDDRTPEEMNRLSTRWSTSVMYLSEDTHLRNEHFSPSDVPRHLEIEEQLRKGGMDPVMALYFANLHLRDPLVLYADETKVKDMSAADIHQSICGSVWAHVRLKVPRGELPDGVDHEDEGWRVEFRPMEVQFTDFANASFLVFMQLLRQVLMDLRLDLYIPLELTRNNMSRAHAKNSVLNETFWFPRTLHADKRGGEDWLLMSVDEIVNGQENQNGSTNGTTNGTASYGKFEGLIPLIRNNISPQLREGVSQYLDFISERASGRRQTPATWQREFVLGHPEYAQDSVVTPRIAYDMMSEIRHMGDLF